VCAQGASGPALCPPGQFCAPGAAQGATCPSGSFCAPGVANYSVCPPGYLCPAAGLSAPRPCPDGGYYCPRGSVAALPCGANMGVAQGLLASNATQCLCLAGFYLSPTDGRSCVACPDLTFQPLLARASLCQPCPWGSLDGGQTCPPQPTTSGAPPVPTTTPAPAADTSSSSSIGVIAGGAGAAVGVVAVGFGAYYGVTLARGVGSAVSGMGGSVSLKNAEARLSREDEEAGRRLLGHLTIGRVVQPAMLDVVVTGSSTPSSSSTRKNR